MMIVRVLAALAKPALAGGIVVGSAAGGYAAWDRYNGPEQTAFQRLQAQDTRLVINEFGVNEDTIYAVDPLDVTSRDEIATIAHAEEFGAFATLSPDGEAIAYTALPPETEDPSPASPAVAGVVDASGDVVVLANDIDLLIPPVWAPDSSAIVVRKNTPEEDSAGSFELVLLGRDGARSTITTWRSAAIFPIAFSPDGARLYYATLNETGTDLYVVAPDGSGETMIAHLSDEIARDWRLSPDGATLAYSAAESGPRPRIVAMTLDLATGAISVVSPGPYLPAYAELNPVFDGDGELTMASVSDDASTTGATGAAPLASSDGSIDLPLSWSPDDATLAVRSIEGLTALDAGASHVALIDAAGNRQRVSEIVDVQIVGWTE